MENNNIEQQKILKVFKLINRLTYGMPAKESKLSSELEISKSTFYRYIDLLKELGYAIQTDAEARYSITTISSNYKSFTTFEKKYLTSLVSSAAKKTKTHHTILAKLGTSDGIPSPQISNLLDKVAIIERVVGAIETKNALTLVKYKSTSTDSVDKDRHIMPIHLDEHKLALLAYDYDEKDFRIYKLQRVTGLDIYDVNGKFDIPSLAIPTLDPFGFSSIQKIKIELLMTKRAATILIEENNVDLHKITPTRDPIFSFRYKETVSSYQGIGRFVLGLCAEIKIVKDEDFILYIKNKLKGSTLL